MNKRKFLNLAGASILSILAISAFSSIDVKADDVPPTSPNWVSAGVGDVIEYYYFDASKQSHLLQKYEYDSKENKWTLKGSPDIGNQDKDGKIYLLKSDSIAAELNHVYGYSDKSEFVVNDNKTEAIFYSKCNGDCSTNGECSEEDKKEEIKLKGEVIEYSENLTVDDVLAEKPESVAGYSFGYEFGNGTDGSDKPFSSVGDQWVKVSAIAKGGSDFNKESILEYRVAYSATFHGNGEDEEKLFADSDNFITFPAYEGEDDVRTTFDCWEISSELGYSTTYYYPGDKLKIDSNIDAQANFIYEYYAEFLGNTDSSCFYTKYQEVVVPEYTGGLPDKASFECWTLSTDGGETYSCYNPGDTVKLTEDAYFGAKILYADGSNDIVKVEASNNNNSKKEETETAATETKPVTKNYTAVENTTTENWNKPYSADVNASHGNLGNHTKAQAPVCLNNSSLSGWAQIKADISTKTQEELAASAYDVNMNGSTKVDNGTLDSLADKNLPYARFKMENNATFVLPTNISEKNTEAFSNVSGNKASFYLDITCNTTTDVKNKVIDTQFIPFNLIKSVNGNENSRMIAVRTNNQDLTNIGAIKLNRTDATKTKVSLYLYDNATNSLKSVGTYDYNADGQAVVYVSLANWNLLVVEE